MSMIGCFRTTSNEDLEALFGRPERIQKFLYGIDFSEGAHRSWLFKFFQKKKPEVDHWIPKDEGADFDVDKAWHGIHYLLCDEPWEGKGVRSFILAGGRSIGSVDVGYGPARAFTSDEVKAIAEELSAIESKDLEAKCNAQDFAEKEIYPNIWDEPFDECFGYILSYFEELKEFILNASRQGKALIVYMS